VRAGEASVGVIHTPGHTPGSLCFSLTTKDGALLFAGDTLFRRGIGRTDLWGGDSDKIIASIEQRLYVLDPMTKVITGHGPATTIGDESRANPFVRRG
jgi:glyoxylase-like metal-dependent hydrolase (beta-lactamase superfamily II)